LLPTFPKAGQGNYDRDITLLYKVEPGRLIVKSRLSTALTLQQVSLIRALAFHVAETSEFSKIVL
jgi:hypothetical protein